MCIRSMCLGFVETKHFSLRFMFGDLFRMQTLFRGPYVFRTCIHTYLLGASSSQESIDIIATDKISSQIKLKCRMNPTAHVLMTILVLSM